MALPSARYQANLASVKEKVEKLDETHNVYGQDGSKYQVMRTEPPLSSVQGISWDPNAIPQTLRPLVFGNTNGGHRLSNISLQTGEEFAWEFSPEGSHVQQERNIGNVPATKGNHQNVNWPNPHAYEDIRGILGIARMDSGVNSEKSYAGADWSSRDFEGSLNAGNSESTQGMRNPYSTNDAAMHHTDGGFVAHSGLQTRYPQISYYSNRKSNLSESSKASYSSKLKFMCSYGGKFLPRPRDGKLRYVGGETHLISVNKDISYDNFIQKVTDIYGGGLILKYQLPGEDLDALVSVSCDEDLENMMDEYEKVANDNGTCKLRIFIFDSVDHDYGHFNVLADRRESEQLYVDAVNGIPHLGLRKSSESTGGMMSHRCEHMIGLDVTEEQGAQKAAVLSGSSAQKNSTMPTTQACSQMPACASFESSLPQPSPPFFSMPNTMNQSEFQQSLMHVLPIQTMDSDLQSCALLESSQDSYLNESGKYSHEKSYTQAGCEAHNILSADQNLASLIGDFSDAGQQVSRKVPDAYLSTFVSSEANDFLEENYDFKQFLLDFTSTGISSDRVFVSQASQPLQGQSHHRFMEVDPYGFIQPALVPSDCNGIEMQLPVVQTLNPNPPKSLYKKSVDVTHIPRDQSAHNETFEDGQARNSAMKTNCDQSDINQKCSSPSSAHNMTELPKHAQVEHCINVSETIEQLDVQTEQSDNLHSNRGVSPVVSNHSSGHSLEQTCSQEDLGHQEQKNFPQPIPHVQSDTVLQMHLKSAETMGEGLPVLQGHHSESSLTTLPLNSLSSPNDQVLKQNQENDDICSSTTSMDGLKQTLDEIKNETGENFGESSITHSNFGEPAEFNSRLLANREFKASGISRTRMCQSEGEEDEKVSDMLGQSNNRLAASFSRAKSSGNMDTFLTSSLDEQFQAYDFNENFGKQTAGAETKNVLQYQPDKIEGKSANSLDESDINDRPGDLYGFSSMAVGENVADTLSSLRLPCAEEENHSTSCTSEVWWNDAMMKGESSKVETSLYDFGKVGLSSSIADDLSRHHYHGTPLFGKSLMDDDLVEAYKISGISKPKVDGSPQACSDTLLGNLQDDAKYESAVSPSHLISKVLVEETKNAEIVDELSLNINATETTLADISLNDQFNAERLVPPKLVTDSMPNIKISNFNVASTVTTGPEWELVSENARADAHVSDKTTPVVDEESVAIQDSDTEEAKIEYSDKDEPDSDAAIAESEAIAHGLQIIKNADLEELRELGCGTFGTVFWGKWRGSDVAIKRIKNSCFIGTPSMQERMRADFWREACILSQLHHPNVVAFYGVVPDGPGGTLATVTEYMVNGSLKQVLQRKDRSIDRRKRWLITMDAAFGMEYLHSKNIVHFDLKCENLLVNMRDSQRPICKVGDLGLSKVKQHTLVSGGVRGTLPWMAPELLNGSSSMVSEKVDVFSFGIVMWELLTGEEPYANMHYGAIIGGIVNNTLRPPVPSWCDPAWRALMEQCWSADPAVRPSFTEIANRLRSTATSLHARGQSHHAQVHYG